MNPFIEAQKRNGQMTAMSSAPQNQNTMVNPMNLINEFNDFLRSFRGNPKTMVDQLISSGRINQEQYNNAVQMANQMSTFLGMK